jgi:hypothetical protein
MLYQRLQLGIQWLPPADRPMACCGNIILLTCWQSPRRFLQSLKVLVHASGNLMIGEHAAGL